MVLDIFAHQPCGSEAVLKSRVHAVLKPACGFLALFTPRDEEKKEVSLALKNLRCKYDDIHKATVEKEEALKLLVKGVEKITEEEILVEKQTKGGG